MHLNIPNIFPIARLNKLTFKKNIKEIEKKNLKHTIK
jgi:hypothetical protein